MNKPFVSKNDTLINDKLSVPSERTIEVVPSTSFFSAFVDLRPSAWTAWRTYSSASGECRSIIANEKTHRKVFLDDDASRLWGLIEKGISYKDLLVEASNIGVEDELDSFLEELNELELISDQISLLTEDAIAEPAPQPMTIEDADNSEAERLFQEWVMKQGFMYHTHWELTYRCNERCVHCYNPGASHSASETPQRENDELSTEQVLSSLDSFAKGGVFGLTLTGGEIMLRRDFYEIVAYARSLGMSVNIYTNALKLDEVAISRLAKLWVSSVSVSVYSHIAKVHDDITRVKGSYDKAVKALEKLNKLGIKTSLKSVQMSHTLMSYNGVIDLSKQLGAAAETELGLSPGVDGAIAPMLMSTQDPAQLIVAAATPGFPIFVGDISNNFGEFKKDPQATVCAAGYSGLSVAADGNIYPCNSLPIKSGNLHDNDPLDIWNSALKNRVSATDLQRSNSSAVNGLEDVTANLSKWQDVRLKDYNECGTHSRCSWCVKCPGMALMETGNALSPSTSNCRIANARMFAAILLRSGKSRQQIADEMGVDRNYGSMEPLERPEIVEPSDGRSSQTDPRASVKIFRKDGSLMDLDKGNYTFTSLQNEVWLNSGSRWNVQSMKEFDNIREKSEVLRTVCLK